MLRWLFLAALWLALTDTHKEPELIAGTGTSGVRATVAARIRNIRLLAETNATRATIRSIAV